MLVVLDTNVLVGGLLSPFGPPGRIVDLVVGGTLRVAFDDRIMAEYFDVLSRPTFRFPESAIHGVLSHIQASGVHVLAAPFPLVLPDPDDQPFIEVALTSGARFVITGNPRHFPVDDLPDLLIVGPVEFMDALGRGL